ncbi:hypothetical protein LTR53_005908 [Teratosphaeriaceae sp. CCFEE 6253]|nr:hypothetical protein LTR53_009481 [Teratosphaeriaceae sp. CCFEE 6253]KAK3115092.1 hypothetical protein LTR53_005908 [Teratosphaeriaceae sp. CCFEE 6253]
MDSRMGTPLSTFESTFGSEKPDDYSDKYSLESDASRSTPASSENAHDLEAQSLLEQDGVKEQDPAHSTPTSQPDQAAPERRTALSTKLIYLGAYFLLNLTLTVSNKAIMTNVRFPWLLTTMHASATSLGCFALMGLGYLEVKRLTTRETLVLTAFSFLFTLNIAISNVSLAAVSVPFHQILRSTCPVATILIYKVVYARGYSTQTYLSMIPLILGVALATAGDYYATLVGFLLTALGVVLAAVKTVATNRLITGQFSPLEVLLLMSPLAAIQCVVYAFAAGEVAAVRIAIADGAFSSPMLGGGLLVNACMAFVLNIVSFQTNKVAGALTISVCGNVKQALTILLGIVLFHVHVGMLNAFGMLVTLGGAAYYSKVELDTKRSKSAKG